MSKKIDAARKRLTKALKKHAAVVGGSAVSLKKAQRAATEIHQAAIDYSAVVQAKTGIESPFPLLWQDGLEPSTVASLIAERDAMAGKKSKK
jgi:C4-dicarboxylate transporter